MLSKLIIFIDILILLFFYSSIFIFSNTEPKGPLTITKSSTPVVIQNTAPNFIPPKPTIFTDVEFNQSLPILMYHSIANFSDIPLNDSNPKLSHGLRIPPKVFKEQLELIKKNGYTTIKFEDISNYTKFYKPLPAKPIILTFDDGWADNVIAYNQLKEMNMIGNFAIVSGFIDKPGRLSAQQIKEFHDNGMEISSHSVTHGNLSSMSATNLKNELVNSKTILEQFINKEVNTIVYPTGAYNNAVIEAAKLAGYQFGTNTKGYINSQDLKKPFELTRVRVECDTESGIRVDKCSNMGGNFFLKLK